eukprot:m.769224 g.769224  ORF g.769224 m.769224 type:complete len:300 (-) comp59079_c0_seq14:1584-2483(-)
MAPSTDRNLCVSPGQSSQRSSRLSDSIPVASAAVQTAIDRLGLRNSVKPRELKSSSLTLLNKLGSGKFGVVFKALMLEEASGLPNYMVAVKLLQKNSHSFKQRSDFLLEGVLLAQFHHQNVLNLLGQVSLGGDLMLVTPYCEFGALNSFLSEHSHEVPLCALVGVCADIASGMAYVHALEIIHCDLSARNVLVAADYQCKVEITKSPCASAPTPPFTWVICGARLCALSDQRFRAGKTSANQQDDPNRSCSPHFEPSSGALGQSRGSKSVAKFLASAQARMILVGGRDYLSLAFGLLRF